MKRIIKNYSVIIIILLLTGSTIVISSSNISTINTNSIVDVSLNQINNKIEISYKINDYKKIPINIDGLEYNKIQIDNEPNILKKGFPDLPVICRSIIVDDAANMKINIRNFNFVEYENILIAPSKGNLMRSVNPDDIAYEFGDIYNKDTWFPNKITNLREPYIIRDFRGQVVEIYPIQYNPIKKIMRVFTDITIEVLTDGKSIVNCINRDKLPEKIDSDFKFLYNRHFINFDDLYRYDPIEEQGNMLIITYDDFWDTMVPFVHWKNLKGIPTEMINVSSFGSGNDIKTYIDNYYNDPGLTFVLLVGDISQIPSLGGYTASDPSYSFIVGSDHYPDIFVGRFSAQNVGQLVTQVERSIEYEKYPMDGSLWYHKGAGVASSLGPGDDGEMDYEHLRNIRTKLMAYTYDEVDELYDGSQGGDDAPGNPTPTMVSAAINNGRSVINYCGHGSPTGWSSSGFSNYDINNLVNDNMIPYVVCVACNNGQFDDYDECFCEAWLRATNNQNGEPTGAIAATGSSTGMSWNPPMDGQDEMMDLLVGTYSDNIKHTIGGIHANGCMHMNDEYGASGFSETDHWHIFGDPSLQIRTDIPTEMTINHPNNIDISTWSLEVEVIGIKGALCALSRNNELFGSAYTNEYGIADIVITDPPVGNDPLDLVVTGYNKKPYYGIILINSAPEIPDKPDGPATVRVGQKVFFSTQTSDYDGDQIYYKWRWEDGNYSDWLGPYDSGETVSASHIWKKSGNFNIRVMAKDTFEQETNWSESLIINVKKGKEDNSPFIVWFLERLLDRFPKTFSKLFQLLIL